MFGKLGRHIAACLFFAVGVAVSALLRTLYTVVAMMIIYQPFRYAFGWQIDFNGTAFLCLLCLFFFLDLKELWDKTHASRKIRLMVEKKFNSQRHPA